MNCPSFAYIAKKERGEIVKRKIRLLIMFAVALGIIVLSQKLSSYVQSAAVGEKEVEVVIDAGHGGADPGKVGVNNVLEKDINLQIAKKIQRNLENIGISVAMTRDDDQGFYDDAAGNKKLADMEKRVKMIEEVEPKVVVSIHQNSYSDSSVTGAQVFYHGLSKEGETLAQVLQEELWTLNPEKKRQIKANDTYYMLRKTKVPTVIVECGFLSNYEEAQKLMEETYQEELSLAITNGIIKWLDKSTE